MSSKLSPQTPLVISEISGKWVIITIFTLAIVGALASLMVRRNATRHTLEFWGVERITAIRDAKKIDLIEFYSTTDSTEPTDTTKSLQFGDWTLPVRQRLDVSKAGGYVHLKATLWLDRSYNWEHTPPSEPDWRYALRFENEEGLVTTVLISADYETIGRVETEPGDHRPRTVSCKSPSEHDYDLKMDYAFRTWIPEKLEKQAVEDVRKAKKAALAEQEKK